jgi:uncharacterized protein (DUF302 family)
MTRFSVVSTRPFDEVVERLTATIGHPDLNAFTEAMAAAKDIADLEKVVQGAIGSAGLMEFTRFDPGEVIRKEHGGEGFKMLRLLVGNPLIMKEMAKTVPDAASYAPLTILVDERDDGVHLSYDSMASLLTPYESEPALAVARDLDLKFELLLESAAGTAGKKMPTMNIKMKRVSVVSTKPFDEVVERLTATIGHPDIKAYYQGIAAARNLADLEEVVHGAIGSSGLMEFVRFDPGEVLRKEHGGEGFNKMLRFVFGNPLIMKELVKAVPDAASYAPVTILVDERDDGVHLSHDSMVSMLTPYESEPALAIARDSDLMIERLLEAAAGADEPQVMTQRSV